MWCGGWLGCVSKVWEDIDNSIVLEVDVSFVLDVEGEQHAAIDRNDGAVARVMTGAGSIEAVGEVSIDRFLDARFLKRCAGEGRGPRRRWGPSSSGKGILTRDRRDVGEGCVGTRVLDLHLEREPALSERAPSASLASVGTEDRSSGLGARPL